MLSSAEIGREDGRAENKPGVSSDLDSGVVVPGLDDRGHGTEDLLFFRPDTTTNRLAAMQL